MNKKGHISADFQTSFDFDAHKWPEQSLFPLNLKSHRRTVASIVYKDIDKSSDYIIITGFTSLSNLVDLFGSKDFQNLEKVRILIGFEPNIRGRKKYVKLKLDKEIKDYWLKKGLSIMLGGAIMNLIDKIDRRKIEFRYKDKLHAKIYVGNDSAVLGSSNFSKNGLNYQEEANIRVNKDSGHTEKRQYESIRLIAESYYEEATPYNDKIKELLMELIKEVTWEEALARAIAEILEGNWLNDYKAILTKLEQTKLWPTQWKGITQAVSILQTQSNVLIADPTGAGKTKLCTSLVLSLKHWLYEIGKNYKTNSLIICPPLVVTKWEDEFRALRKIDNSQISMGLLSHSSTQNKKRIIEDLSLANILTIDEAHNYLSPTSNRTGLIKSNRADYKILVTATPISKKVEDLLKLIELLDIDNLSDEDFERYKTLINKPYLKSNDNDIQNLRNFISKFTVRRTKKSLNKEIDKEPEKYINKLNKTCKFPKQKEKTYTTKETESDKEIVRQINELTSHLKGVTYLTSFHKPNFEISKQESLEGYIKKRIGAGKALSTYMIRAALRSSHIALVEHIEGSQKAMDYFKFKGKSNHTGDKIKKISDLIELNKLPRKNKIFNKELFPIWLINKEEYITICKQELEIYKKISSLAKKLSGQRELGKVEELVKNSKKHQNILAFDSTVITLYYLKQLFEEKYPNQKLLVASGSEKDNDSKKVMELFNLQSQSNENCIALCSDKMSESIDLQKASSIVLLDLPSVLRIVEQRIGRVDRMDSLHKEIEIYWPDDSEEYSLKTDSRLIYTNDMVEDIFGSNFEIPTALKEKHFSQTDSTNSLIKEYKDFIDKDESWSGIHDSFQSVIELKEGKNALISEGIYEEFKDVSSEIKTRVSFIGSEKDWCFIALKGDKNKSPRWYFIDENNVIHTDFPDVCNSLRESIGKESKKLKWDDNSLHRFINLFKQKERDLLPPKKKRALDVAEYILSKKVEGKNKNLNQSLRQSIRVMLNLLKPNSIEAVDYERLAEEWIEILQPHLDAKREQNKRKKTVLNLSSLKSDYKKIDLDMERINEMIESSTIVDEIDNKIASCIIGISDNKD
ncbi:SNF2-related protein [Flavobacterium sp. RHBU_3]|uniref:SNF2-related protein n=1 Tax=Flavobacterium sp. RHBU_3 TaxID=3391184 RepID=UPI003984AF4A